MNKKIRISGEFIRLDALLKFTGLVGTGGEAKLRITQGEVKLNGEVCTVRGKKIKSGDQITTGGHCIEIE